MRSFSGLAGFILGLAVLTFSSTALAHGTHTDCQSGPERPELIHCGHPPTAEELRQRRCRNLRAQARIPGRDVSYAMREAGCAGALVADPQQLATDLLKGTPVNKGAQAAKEVKDTVNTLRSLFEGRD